MDDCGHWSILLAVSPRFIDQWNASSMDNINHLWIFAKSQVILRDEIINGGEMGKNKECGSSSF